MAFVWELTKETIHLPLGCLQGGSTTPDSCQGCHTPPTASTVSQSGLPRTPRGRGFLRVRYPCNPKTLCQALTPNPAVAHATVTPTNHTAPHRAAVNGPKGSCALECEGWLRCEVHSSWQ